MKQKTQLQLDIETLRRLAKTMDGETTLNAAISQLRSQKPKYARYAAKLSIVNGIATATITNVGVKAKKPVTFEIMNGDGAVQAILLLDAGESRTFDAPNLYGHVSLMRAEPVAGYIDNAFSSDKPKLEAEAVWDGDARNLVITVTNRGGMMRFEKSLRLWADGLQTRMLRSAKAKLEAEKHVSFIVPADEVAGLSKIYFYEGTEAHTVLDVPTRPPLVPMWSFPRPHWQADGTLVVPVINVGYADAASVLFTIETPFSGFNEIPTVVALNVTRGEEKEIRLSSAVPGQRFTVNVDDVDVHNFVAPEYHDDAMTLQVVCEPVLPADDAWNIAGYWHGESYEVTVQLNPDQQFLPNIYVYLQTESHIGCGQLASFNPGDVPLKLALSGQKPGNYVTVWVNNKTVRVLQVPEWETLVVPA